MYKEKFMIAPKGAMIFGQLDSASLHPCRPHAGQRGPRRPLAAMRP